MKQKLVLLDIDYTLFDSISYRKAFQKKLAELAHDHSEEFLEKAEEAYTASRRESHNFDPDLFLAKLQANTSIKIDTNAFKRILTDEDFVADHVYTDVLPVLQKISAIPHVTLGIFSAGNLAIQNPKIASLRHFFKEEAIHIFERKKIFELSHVLSLYPEEKVYIVDDILEILYEAKKHHPDIITVWVQRNAAKASQKIDNFRPSSIIESLQELPGVLEQK